MPSNSHEDHSTQAQRSIDLEVKISFLEQQVSDLAQTLAKEVREHLSLHERVGVLEKALRVLAQRSASSGGTGEDVGADAATDPVPHSG